MKTATKERPIIFSGPMVRAILEGRKTQTRRVVKPQFHQLWGYGVRHGEQRFSAHVDIMLPNGEWKWLYSPYSVGDRLWVRETWARSTRADSHRIAYRADGKCVGVCGNGDGGWMQIFHGWLFPDVRDKGPSLGRGLYGAWKPSIHMPRWASRITLEVTEVRVQRVQEIGEDDAFAEGCLPDERQVQYTDGTWSREVEDIPARWVFRELWDRINGKKCPWSSNPWVWVITFRRVEDAQ